MLIENQAAMETGGVGSLGSAAGRRRGEGRGGILANPWLAEGFGKVPPAGGPRDKRGSCTSRPARRRDGGEEVAAKHCHPPALPPCRFPAPSRDQILILIIFSSLHMRQKRAIPSAEEPGGFSGG